MTRLLQLGSLIEELKELEYIYGKDIQVQIDSSYDSRADIVLLSFDIDKRQILIGTEIVARRLKKTCFSCPYCEYKVIPEEFIEGN